MCTVSLDSLSLEVSLPLTGIPDAVTSLSGLERRLELVEILPEGIEPHYHVNELILGWVNASSKAEFSVVQTCTCGPDTHAQPVMHEAFFSLRIAVRGNCCSLAVDDENTPFPKRKRK